MNNVNKTLYIPLYGKAFVSRKGIILNDKKAEEIWDKERFELKGKSKSKWLCYYMGIRAAFFDEWLKEKMAKDKNAVVVHIGCGMDSRIERVGANNHHWYDVDFPDVIAERKLYYNETEFYHMIESDARNNNWINKLPATKRAIIVLEGVTMYFKLEELKKLLASLNKRFASVEILMDCYTTRAASASKYKNPINDVGVTEVYGLDEPKLLEDKTGLRFIGEFDMTPPEMINELKGAEKFIFKHVFGGRFSKGMYRMYYFQTAKIK